MREARRERKESLSLSLLGCSKPVVVEEGQNILDVVLPTPSVFEENMLSTLSSFIFFNKVDIVSQIQEDEKFLDELFTQVHLHFT